MTIKTHISAAGKYPVVQVPCPNFDKQLVDLSAPRAAVLHTTEGGWAGSMGVFKVHYAPHFLLGKNTEGKVEIAQLVPIGVIGAALVTHNNKAIVQVEMIGFSQEKLWVPDEETLDALASLMVVCRDEWGVPLSHPWKVGDYGRAGNNPHRSSGKYGTVAGWFGHADVPSPDTHWDPGNLNWDAIFTRARSLPPTTPSAPAPAAAPVAQQNTTRGDTQVFAVQKALNKIALQPPLLEDGVFGSKTKAAIVRYQSAYGIFTSGKIDDATLKALNIA